MAKKVVVVGKGNPFAKGKETMKEEGKEAKAGAKGKKGGKKPFVLFAKKK